MIIGVQIGDRLRLEVLCEDDVQAADDIAARMLPALAALAGAVGVPDRSSIVATERIEQRCLYEVTVRAARVIGGDV